MASQEAAPLGFVAHPTSIHRAAAEPTGIDKRFAKSGVVMILAAILVPFIVMVANLFGMALCNHPEAKRGAKVFAIGAGIWSAVSMLIFLNLIQGHR